MKTATSKTNGNVFKTIIRSVVREEVTTIVRKEMKPLREELRKEMGSFKQEMKGEMGSFKQEMKGEMGSFKQEMKGEMGSFKEEMTENMEGLYAKYRDDVLTKLDVAIGTLKKTDEEQAMHSGQHDAIADRLDALESIHPRGKHA